MSALLHLKQDAAALHQCDLALHTDPTSVKALYRRALVYQGRGLYRAAMTDLDNALAHATRLGLGGTSDIKAALDACEDALDAHGDAGADALDALRAEAAAAAPSPVAPPTSSIARAFLDEVVEDAVHEWGAERRAASRVMLRHPTDDAAAGHSIGRINIEHAFATAQSLSDCCSFIRGQHVVTSADAIAVVVQKRDVLFPKVWWASADWPFAVGEGSREGAVDESDASVDGVFVEVEERATGHRASVFLRAEGSPAELSSPVDLPADCLLLANEPRLLV